METINLLHYLVSLTRQTPWALNCFFAVLGREEGGGEQVKREVIWRVCLCCCVCRVVAGAGPAVVGALQLVWMLLSRSVLSVAVGVAGGESVRNMSVLRGWDVRRCCGHCACRFRPRCLFVKLCSMCLAWLKFRFVSLRFSIVFLCLSMSSSCMYPCISRVISCRCVSCVCCAGV